MREARLCGGATVTGGLPPAGTVLPVDIVSLVAKEWMLKGSYIGTCVPACDIPRSIAPYRTGRLPVDRLHAGQAVRQIVRLAT